MSDDRPILIPQMLPEESEIKAGYLILRLKHGWGIMVNGNVEFRVHQIKNYNEVQIAIKAPKEYLIRKLK